MFHSATAASRALANPSAAFEALEARLVLSAPTVTPLSVDIQGVVLLVGVVYHSDTPLDVSTIDDQDLTVTGPAGSLAARLSSTTDRGNGEVEAHYFAEAPNGRWDWPSANGTYVVSIGAD